MQPVDLNSDDYNKYERELRDISVGTVHRLGAARPEIWASVYGNDWRFISSLQRQGQIWGRRVSLQYLTGAPFPSLKWPERKAHLHLESTVKIGGAPVPVPQMSRGSSA